MAAVTVREVIAWPVEIPLADEFAIASGSITSARSVFVRLTLSDGTSGYGECAPFPPVTGETQDSTLRAIERMIPSLIGLQADRWGSLAAKLAGSDPFTPAARCGLEMALLDAHCRTLGIPMWQFLGDAEQGPFETDVTIPIHGKHKSLRLAQQWIARGFRILKIKVGRDLETDIALLAEIARKFPNVSFVVDANEGFSETEAEHLIDSLHAHQVTVRLIEQPLKRDQIEGMARLRRRSPYPICADESVGSVQDAERVIRVGAADIINIKIMKSGVAAAVQIATLARAAGVGVMYGGMVETRLAMGCSLALAAGLGEPHTLDLDTPLLMREDPVEGGCEYDVPLLRLWDGPGLGAIPKGEWA